MMKNFFFGIAILLLTAPIYPASHSAAFESAQSKFAQLSSNATSAHSDAQPIVVTDSELNAYVNEGGVKLPVGVNHVTFATTPGLVTGTARVDFDKITAGRRSRSMWMMLFNGVHDVKATATAKAESGTGEVHVQSVELDGVDVPRPALEFLVDRFIKPKYGNNVGLDSQFQMPARIDRATLGEAKVTLEQK